MAILLEASSGFREGYRVCVRGKANLHPLPAMIMAAMFFPSTCKLLAKVEKAVRRGKLTAWSQFGGPSAQCGDTVGFRFGFRPN